jgi:uncharacterized coiled-coil protein SlyX
MTREAEPHVFTTISRADGSALAKILREFVGKSIAEGTSGLASASRVAQLTDRLGELEARLAQFEKRVAAAETRLAGQSRHLGNLQTRVDAHCALENEQQEESR